MVHNCFIDFCATVSYPVSHISDPKEILHTVYLSPTRGFYRSGKRVRGREKEGKRNTRLDKKRWRQEFRARGKLNRVGGVGTKSHKLNLLTIIKIFRHTDQILLYPGNINSYLCWPS